VCARANREEPAMDVAVSALDREGQEPALDELGSSPELAGLLTERGEKGACCRQAMTLTRFTWGASGARQIDRILSVGGPTLAPAQRLHVFQASRASDCRAAWTLSGASSFTRYTSRPVPSSRRSTLARAP